MGFASQSASGGDIFAELPVPVPTAGPTPLQLAIVEHRTAIVSGTVAGHFAHWKFLTRFRHVDLYASANRRFFAAAGLGWAFAYLAVLSTITIAQRKVSKYGRQPSQPSPLPGL